MLARGFAAGAWLEVVTRRAAVPPENCLEPCKNVREGKYASRVMMVVKKKKRKKEKKSEREIDFYVLWMHEIYSDCFFLSTSSVAAARTCTVGHVHTVYSVHRKGITKRPTLFHVNGIVTWNPFLSCNTECPDLNVSNQRLINIRCYEDH